jgi:hypothetical protein
LPSVSVRKESSARTLRRGTCCRLMRCTVWAQDVVERGSADHSADSTRVSRPAHAWRKGTKRGELASPRIGGGRHALNRVFLEHPRAMDSFLLGHGSSCRAHSSVKGPEGDGMRMEEPLAEWVGGKTFASSEKMRMPIAAGAPKNSTARCVGPVVMRRCASCTDPRKTEKCLREEMISRSGQLAITNRRPVVARAKADDGESCVASSSEVTVSPGDVGGGSRVYLGLKA